MPSYTFKNKETKEHYDKIMSYKELIDYIKNPNIEQVYKINLFRYSDNNGIKDQEMNFLKDPKIHGNGKFEPYGKVKTEDENKIFKAIRREQHFGEDNEKKKDNNTKSQS
jgi:hypothetical protein